MTDIGAMNDNSVEFTNSCTSFRLFGKKGSATGDFLFRKYGERVNAADIDNFTILPEGEDVLIPSGQEIEFLDFGIIEKGNVGLFMDDKVYLKVCDGLEDITHRETSGTRSIRIKGIKALSDCKISGPIAWRHLEGNVIEKTSTGKKISYYASRTMEAISFALLMLFTIFIALDALGGYISVIDSIQSSIAFEIPSIILIGLIGAVQALLIALYFKMPSITSRLGEDITTIKKSAHVRTPDTAFWK